MTITDPIDNENPSNNLICPRCGTSLLPQALFCNVCGQRIYKKKDEQGESRDERNEEAHEQEVGDTVRIPRLSQAKWRSFHSDRSLQNQRLSAQTPTRGIIPQDTDALPFDKLTTPPTSIPDIDTKKQGPIPLSQHLEQQTTQLLSIIGAARKQIADRLISNNGSIRGNDAVIEGTKDVVGKKQTFDEAPTVSNKNLAVTGSSSNEWGWLPILSLVSAVGTFLVALAYEAGRVAAVQWPLLLFWIGLLLIFLPIAMRLFLSKPTRRERIALLILLAINLYFVTFLEYPLFFSGYDEFSHLRTAFDIVRTGHLFHENPLLPISSFYPGLEIATTALSSLTGLSLFISGSILIGIVHVIFVLALYLFYERFTGSARVAGIAAVLYMVNPGFLFFDMSFAYESFALPLALFVLFAVVCRSSINVSNRRGLTLAIWLGIGAVVITHHVTSFALVTFLILWTVLFIILCKIPYFHKNPFGKVQVALSPGATGLLALVLCIAWLVYTAGIAVGYLMPHLSDTLQQLTQILARESTPRQLFHNTSGFALPLWERLMAYASVALILLSLPLGFFRIWHYHRGSALALALAAAALAYPASQALRLTPAGGETGDRATEFVFLGVAFVLAIGVEEFWFSRISSWSRTAMVMCMLVIISFGQMILGSGQPWALLPGPYLVSADAHSIEPEGITAAEWANSYLGPGHRIASDRINTLLMATYGYEQVITGGNGNNSVAPVFTSLHFGPGVIGILQQDRIQYLVVDRRLSTSLPYVGTYFNKPANGGAQITNPIASSALAKFDGIPNLNRIFDSGNIIIYNVEAITNRALPISTIQSLCTPSPSTTVSISYPTMVKQYNGKMFAIPNGRSVEISLTGIQQQGNSICGSFKGDTFNSLPANDSFKGSITTHGQIQFMLTSNPGRATFSFTGIILPSGSINGTYCSTGVGTGKCSDYGLWSVSPAQSG